MRTIIVIVIILIILLGIAIGIYSFALKNIDQDNTSGMINHACFEIGCDANDVFVGSINSDKYYECNCRYAKNINPENIICFKTEQEAEADNRTRSKC
jgi:hypothetical protein